MPKGESKSTGMMNSVQCTDVFNTLFIDIAILCCVDYEIWLEMFLLPMMIMRMFLMVFLFELRKVVCRKWICIFVFVFVCLCVRAYVSVFATAFTYDIELFVKLTSTATVTRNTHRRLQ